MTGGFARLTLQSHLAASPVATRYKFNWATTTMEKTGDAHTACKTADNGQLVFVSASRGRVPRRYQLLLLTSNCIELGSWAPLLGSLASCGPGHRVRIPSFLLAPCPSINLRNVSSSGRCRVSNLRAKEVLHRRFHPRQWVMFPETFNDNRNWRCFLNTFTGERFYPLAAQPDLDGDCSVLRRTHEGLFF
ncbi:hypothetical protein PR202_ga29472 [Eleusine coracana subsp. coracana]|uniref:Uncharacterized protein n=1 Tax=Eleusine coracana subsp. coracana TaxID=191504 RepID=A0AAV5DME4_ELECO|nr:hypothetical protein PR202_ga29472 [Eleusine coracana subsp. coracana]